MHLNLNLRQFFLILTIVFIPYSALYIMGSPYLFLPMVFFMGYFVLSITRLKGLLNLKGAGKLLGPWVVIWFLILLGIIVNYLPEYNNVYRSVLQRRIMYLVFFLIAYNEIRRNSAIKIKIDQTIVFSIFVMGVFYFTGTGLTIDLEGRLSFFGAGVNTIGVWSAIAILISMDIIIQRRYKRKFFPYYAFVIFIGFIIMASTGSRKAVFMLGFGILTYLIFLNRSIKFKLILIIPFVVLSYFGYNYITQESVFQQRMEREMERRTLGGRLPIWEETLQVVKENLVIGAGPGLVREELERSSLGRSRSAHNEFITIAVLAGIPGFITFVYFLWVLAQGSYRNLRRENTSVIPLVLWVIVVIYLFTAGGGLNTFITWFLFAYIAGSTEPLSKQVLSAQKI
jgi:O-antigen ligase